MPSGCAAGLAAATQGGTILCSLKWQATFFIHISIAEKDFLVAQMVKNPPAMRETKVQSLGCEDHLEKGMQPTPVFLPGEFHRQESLVGYSPWGPESEQLTLSLFFLSRANTFDPPLTV